MPVGRPWQEPEVTLASTGRICIAVRSTIVKNLWRMWRLSALPISAPNLAGRTVSSVTSKKPTVTHTAKTLLRDADVKEATLGRRAAPAKR